MRDLRALLDRMRDEGYFEDITTNPAAQFGTPEQPLLGATLLPERNVTENAFREHRIRFRTNVANDSTRYSPIQIKGNEMVASMLVELGDSDVGAEFSARDYDTLLEHLRGRRTMEGMTQLINWSEIALNRALIQNGERQIWQAIVNALVIRRGDNGYYEEVKYSNPAGHRRNALGQWSNPAYDPFDSDIFPMVDLLASKGYTVNRIFMPKPVTNILAGNPKVQARFGTVTLNIGGQLGIANQRMNIDRIRSVFESNDLPAPEEYNRQWSSQTGTGYYLARNVFVMVATTGLDQTVDLGDDQRFLANTLGYKAVGRAAGQPDPGRVLLLTPFRNKPPRIEGEAWTTHLPVLQEPEGIAVIGGIS